VVLLKVCMRSGAAALSFLPPAICSYGGLCRTGKTTLLRYLLENNKDLKVGCIVNDVANINVDAKLIRNDRNRDRLSNINTTTDLTDTIELQNGCACEFFFSEDVVFT
jgi:Ni2+-binding GTPase involved in maturation of urease and hydrogenase